MQILLNSSWKVVSKKGGWEKNLIGTVEAWKTFSKEARPWLPGSRSSTSGAF